MDCDSYLIIPLISELGENVDYGVKYVVMDLRGQGRRLQRIDSRVYVIACI